MKFTLQSRRVLANRVIVATVIFVVIAMMIPAIQTRRDMEARQGIAESIREGKVRMVERALNARVKLSTSLFENWTAPDGKTANMQYSLLSYAVRYDQPEVAALLLEYGVDVDGTEWGNDRPPIFWAAYNGNEAIFDLLVNAGADLNVEVRGKTAFGHADGAYTEAATFLAERGAK